MKRQFTKNQMLLLFMILSLMLAVGFFIPLGGSSWAGLLIKGALFLTLFVALYMLLFSSTFGSPPETRIPEEQENPSLPEESPAEWEGYGEAFKQYAGGMIAVVKSGVAVVVSAGFYLKKKDGSLELQAGDCRNGQVDSRLRIKENDILHQIVRQKSAIAEGNLPFGITLAGMPGSEIRSFLGVPLIVNEDVAGVLAIGSDTAGSFGEEDVVFLTKCADLLVKVMVLCYRGLSNEADQRIFKVHMNLQRELSVVHDEEDALNVFVAKAKQLFVFERFTLCRRDGEQGVIRYVFGQIDDMDVGKRFPLDAGLSGLIIKRNAAVLIDDLHDGDYNRPRYLSGENPRHGLRSFLGIPLSFGSDTAWGCMTLESRKANLYSNRGKELFVQISVLLESNISRIQLETQLNRPLEDKQNNL